MPSTKVRQIEQRPFGWPSSQGNSYAIASLDEWLAATSLEPGKLCQVFWRELSDCEYRWKNFTTPTKAAQYVIQMMKDQAMTLRDVGVTSEHPTYSGAETAQYI